MSGALSLVACLALVAGLAAEPAESAFRFVAVEPLDQ
jgi:hypothetical protein